MQGCYVEYMHVKANICDNITIVRTPVNASTASKCVTGIYSSNYNVTFYDMDYNNVPYTTEYAVKLTNQLITGLSPSPTPYPTSASSILSPNSDNVISTSTSLTLNSKSL